MAKNDSLYPSPYDPFHIVLLRPVPEEMAAIGAGVGIALWIENVN